MDYRSYGVYKGIYINKNPIKRVVVQTWELVFTGTIYECQEYTEENPIDSPYCYVTVLKMYMPKPGGRVYNQRYRDRISFIEKDMNEYGLHKSYLSPNAGRKWRFAVRFDGGTEGIIVSSSREIPWKEHDKVIYTKSEIKNETIIKVCDSQMP